MNNIIPRTAAIHSLPSFGRSSLSVIMPVLSSMKIQVCPIPTSVLSSHTGGLGDVVKINLDGYITDCFKKYDALGVSFDCIYSGYLGAVEQLNELDFIHKKYSGSFIVVDPVMGDNGSPYRFISDELISGMRHLISNADLITPNITEAYLLLNLPYSAEPLMSDKAKSMLSKLSMMGPSKVIITGVPTYEGMCNLGFDRENDTFFKIKCNYIPVSYPGTGDIFASVSVGSLLSGKSLPISCSSATEFCEKVIKSTYSYKKDSRFGVDFEEYLGMLTDEKFTGSYELL